MTRRARAERNCINCRDRFDKLACRYYFGLPTPNEVGPFCERCHTTIDRHAVKPSKADADLFTDTLVEMVRALMLNLPDSELTETGRVREAAYRNVLAAIAALRTQGEMDPSRQIVLEK